MSAASPEVTTWQDARAAEHERRVAERERRAQFVPEKYRSIVRATCRYCALGALNNSNKGRIRCPLHAWRQR